MAEFDRYAGRYDGGLDNPLKRLVARPGELPFIGYKAEWLRTRLPALGGAAALKGRVLDYGCGTGDLLWAMREEGIGGSLSGFDISAEMVKNAKKRFASGAEPSLAAVPPDWKELPGAPFDLAILCCVLHHIEPADRPGLLRRLARQIVPGGFLVIFEHNPWHPVVRWVVRHTEIDRHARLFSSARARRLAASAGFEQVTVDYLLFGPPRWRALRPIERAVRWLPAGGQYALIGRMPK